ncbi:hypothetical protein P8C59_006391 [Phyllachora maydis]|uniref:Uncharacterized protein n=1 Tax=Phyllachora maydis TaxID=1825666 RepID=A0AAD9I6T1_9PEZI|nr:hypothetical protein P8C59_006391 [Phyllachora maydis]
MYKARLSKRAKHALPILPAMKKAASNTGGSNSIKNSFNKSGNFALYTAYYNYCFLELCSNLAIKAKDAYSGYNTYIEEAYGDSCYRQGH